MFKDKTLLITGGTGFFGNAVLERFLKSDLKEIRIFSRDEKNRTKGQRTEGRGLRANKELGVRTED